MGDLTITIPAPYWITANGRYHWAAKAKKTAKVRELAAWHALAALRAGDLRTYTTVHVCAWIGYPRAGKADPSNASPTVKAILDGLTDAGVWPDDDSEHVVAVEYRRETGKAPPGTHTVRLTLADQEVAW